MARYLEVCQYCTEQGCDVCNNTGLLTQPPKVKKEPPFPQSTPAPVYPGYYPVYMPPYTNPDQQLAGKIMLYFTCGLMFSSIVCSIAIFL